MSANAHLWKRQSGSTFDDGDGFADGSGSGFDDGDGFSGLDWWWTPTGMAVRYSIVVILFGAILLYFVGGYFHAKRRTRKGLPPLRYHRWMVNRRYTPAQAYTPYPQYQQQQAYQMEHYAPPPPAYHSSEAPPPVYQPLGGGSKVLADQSYVHVQPVPQRAGEMSDGARLAAPSTAARQ